MSLNFGWAGTITNLLGSVCHIKVWDDIYEIHFLNIIFQSCVPITAYFDSVILKLLFDGSSLYMIKDNL